jgi:hypothetical protein
MAPRSARPAIARSSHSIRSGARSLLTQRARHPTASARIAERG